MNKTSEKSTKIFESSGHKNNYHKSSTDTPDATHAQFTFFKKPDQQVTDLYEFEQTIGQGHYAVVKLARHRFTGEKVISN